VASEIATLPFPKPVRILDRILRIVLSLTYVMSGVMKWMGAEISVTKFNAIGLDDWFRYFTGGLRMVCGVMLLFPRFAVYAALALACTIVGALIAHYLFGGDPIPPGVLFVLNLAIVWLHRKVLPLPRH
jgi:putative oxidoreductase